MDGFQAEMKLSSGNDIDFGIRCKTGEEKQAKDGMRPDGNRIQISRRALGALKDYINARTSLDGGSGRPLTALPLFARHDDRAGSKMLPISTTTGRNIVKQRVREALGEQAVGSISPHSFRHYFVTMVLRGSGGNLKNWSKVCLLRVSAE
jgi:integrase